MSTPSDPAGSSPKPSIIEASPDGSAQADISPRGFNLRIRQQEILAELGVSALRGTAFETLLDQTVRMVAEGLEAELAKVLEYIPAEKRLLMRAGVGWDAGLVGTATIGADLESPAGYALRTGKPVISNHLENEERFRTPELLSSHSVRRAMNVILQGDGVPYGILEVDSRSEGEFTEHDISFLQGAANILGMAIERQTTGAETQGRAGAPTGTGQRDQPPGQEQPAIGIQHVKLAGSCRSRDCASACRTHRAELPLFLGHTIRLYRSPQIAKIDLAEYLIAVCGDLNEVTPHCEVVCAAPEAIFMSTDRAIRVALLVTELVTNSAKHAYPDGQSGRVWVGLARGNGLTARITVRDDGVGLPADFEMGRGTGLGMRLAMALAQQTDAVIRANRLASGTEFVIEVPLEPSS